jgi:hypothetical protein
MSGNNSKEMEEPLLNNSTGEPRRMPANNSTEMLKPLLKPTRKSSSRSRTRSRKNTITNAYSRPLQLLLTRTKKKKNNNVPVGSITNAYNRQLQGNNNHNVLDESFENIKITPDCDFIFDNNFERIKKLSDGKTGSKAVVDLLSINLSELSEINVNKIRIGENNTSLLISKRVKYKKRNKTNINLITNIDNEIKIYSECINKLVSQRITPYLMNNVLHKKCKDIYLLLNEAAVDNTYSINYLDNIDFNYKTKDFYNIMFQLIYTLKCFNAIKLSHSDLYFKNILVLQKETKPSEKKITYKYFKYGERDVDAIYLENIGIEIRIFNFDRCKKYNSEIDGFTKGIKNDIYYNPYTDISTIIGDIYPKIFNVAKNSFDKNLEKVPADMLNNIYLLFKFVKLPYFLCEHESIEPIIDEQNFRILFLSIIKNSNQIKIEYEKKYKKEEYYIKTIVYITDIYKLYCELPDKIYSILYWIHIFLFYKHKLGSNDEPDRDDIKDFSSITFVQGKYKIEWSQEFLLNYSKENNYDGYKYSYFYSSSEFLEKITDYIKKSPNTNSNNKKKLSITDSFYYFKNETNA